MSTPRSMLVLAVLIVACLRGDALPRSVGGAEPAGASAAAEPRPVLPDGREVIWVDEFDGTRLDRSSWEAYHGTYGDGNGEAACLTPGNVEVSGGILRITARKARTACRGGDVRHYSSGFLGSREVGRYHPLFARYEVRARVPYGQGLWPAFWLRHRSGAATAEVDVLEVLHSQHPGQVQQALHLRRSVGGNVAVERIAVDPVGSATGGWHTYAVEITPAAGGGVRFRFSVDGRTTLTYVDAEAAWVDEAPAGETWDMAVNLAVGGRWAGDPEGPLGYLAGPDVCSLTMRRPQGGPSSCPADGILAAAFPAVLEVDWIRVTTPL